MIECKKVFIDTAPFIYYIEENKNNPQYYDRVQGFFEKCYNLDTDLITSTITVEEYCVMLSKKNEPQRIDIFKRFIKAMDMKKIVIDEEIADKASRIRAEYNQFKSMDALQLAKVMVVDEI